MDGIQVTALWKKRDKNGNLYLTGPLSRNSQVVILKNAYKNGHANFPDYYLYINPKESKEEKPKQNFEEDEL